MTENTSKKPRRKRRTKAQIEAETAPKEVKTDDVIVEMFEESVATSDDPVKEEPVVSAEEPASNYVPQTGLAKLRNKLAQRKLRVAVYEESKKKNE